MSTKEMQQRIRQLEKEMSNVQKRITQLEHRFTCQPIPNDCTEYRGAVFQKKIGGGYREAIFCLCCGAPMAPTAPATHFQCPKCNHTASFPGKRLDQIIENLSAN